MSKKNKNEIPLKNIKITDGFNGKEQARENYNWENPPKEKEGQKMVFWLKGEALDRFKKMMSDDLQTNKTSFWIYLISQEWKARNRKGPGRPSSSSRNYEIEEPNFNSLPDEEQDEIIRKHLGKPDFKNDLPKNFYWAGEYIGPKELQWIKEQEKKRTGIPEPYRP